jgi:hypothetical protein
MQTLPQNASLAQPVGSVAAEYIDRFTEFILRCLEGEEANPAESCTPSAPPS